LDIDFVFFFGIFDGLDHAVDRDIHVQGDFPRHLAAGFGAAGTAVDVFFS